MRKFLYIFLILGSMCTCSAGQLGLLLDWADFRGDSAGKSWLELYSSLRRENFRFVFDSLSNAYIGTLYFSIQVENTDGVVVDSLSYRSPIVIPADEPTTLQFRILNIYQFELPVGDYRVSAYAFDPIANICDTTHINVSLSDYWQKDYGVSGIMLAYTATQSSKDDAFTRLDMKMYPAPSATFDLNYMVLYYYVEFYPPNDEVRTLGINVKVLSSDTLFRSFDTIWKKFNGAGGYIGGFSIAGFPDGYYSLVVELSDSVGVYSFSQKDFLVAKAPERMTSTITPEIGENMRDILYYLLTPSELRRFDKLSPPEKYRFWKKFWAERDSTPQTPENEFMEQYIARWNYANRLFARGNTKGWRTDQGRVYIMYGPPDNIERHSLELSTNSWEVWSYFQKNYFFIFADVLGYDGMKLVHSNVDGEISDPYWNQILFKGQQQIFNKQ